MGDGCRAQGLEGSGLGFRCVRWVYDSGQREPRKAQATEKFRPRSSQQEEGTVSNDLRLGALYDDLHSAAEVILHREIRLASALSGMGAYVFTSLSKLISCPWYLICLIS